MNTVCAVSTPHGKGGISVIRISGKDAIRITSAVTESKKSIEEAESHTVIFAKAVHDGKYIDECLVSVFREPNSFTGEDVCEISCHGSIISVSRIMEALIENGASPAGKGEFTKRAFMNGKMSLTQAEAVSDIIEAKTDSALYAAVNRLEGGISKPIQETREILLDILAQTAADGDFPEEDIEIISKETLYNELKKAEMSLSDLKDSAKCGIALNNGIICAICGIPNTGKSSILNALLDKKKAIVTDVAGTTRDVVEDWTDIEGIPVKLGDTAGIRESGDKVEKIGIEMSYNYIKNADICVFVTEAGRNLTDEEIKISKEIKCPCIYVGNKTDLKRETRDDFLGVSAINGNNIEVLKKKIAEIAGGGISKAMISNERQLEAVIKALKSVKRAIKSMEDGFFSDIVSIDIEEAVASLGEAEGISVNQETVNRVFEKFCIGK